MNLLHLDSSALGAHSVSRELSAAVVADYLQRDPATVLTYHDLAAAPLAHWTPVADAADPDVARGAAMLEEFLAADVVVIGAPMYNFSVPSQLKAWIDRIAIAGKTFRYTAEGPQGLAGGKKIVIASARGGIYSAGPSSAADFQENYLRAVFGFLGVTEIEFIRAEGLAYSNEHKAEAIRDAKAAITDSPRIAA